MNDWKKYVLGFLLCCACLMSNACRTVASLDTSKTDGLFVDVIDSQTEVIETGKDVESTIDTIKTITDEAKITGEIPKEKIVTLIKYVDQGAEQIKAHNAEVDKLTGKITTQELSRQTDNATYAKELANKESKYQGEKIKASIYLRWALIATLAAFVLACIKWFPKLLKIIL